MHSWIKCGHPRHKLMLEVITMYTSLTNYSGPCNLRPLYFTNPSILRPAISDTVLNHFEYKYPSI